MLVVYGCGALSKAPESDLETLRADADNPPVMTFGGGTMDTRIRYLVTQGRFRGFTQDDFIYYDRHRSGSKWRSARRSFENLYWSDVEPGGPCTNQQTKDHCGFLLMGVPIARAPEYVKETLVGMSIIFTEPQPTVEGYWWLKYGGQPRGENPKFEWRKVTIAGTSPDDAWKYWVGRVNVRVYRTDAELPDALMRKSGTNDMAFVHFDESQERLTFSAVPHLNGSPGERIHYGRITGERDQEIFTYSGGQWLLGKYTAHGIEWKGVKTGTTRADLECRPCKDGAATASRFGVIRYVGERVVDSPLWLYSNGELWMASYFLGGMFFDRIGAINRNQSTISVGDVLMQDDPVGGRQSEVLVHNFETGRWNLFYNAGADIGWRWRTVSDTTNVIGKRSFIHYAQLLGNFETGEPGEEVIYMWYATGDMWLGMVTGLDSEMSWQKLKSHDY
jgi:hypothetical protein